MPVVRVQPIQSIHSQLFFRNLENQINSTHSSKLKRFLRNYAQKSTIHGMLYLGENRTLFEKIFWAIMILLSFCCCLFMMSKIWTKYNNSPIILTFSPEQLPVSFIPLPAVTICLENKIDPVKYFNSNESIQSYLLNFYRMVCEADSYSPDFDITEDIYQIVENLQEDFDSIFEYCSVAEVNFNCSDIFVPVFTEEGLCYSFNILDRSSIISDNILPHSNYYNVGQTSTWDLEKGYSQRHNYPFRTFNAGSDRAGLVVGLQTKKEYLISNCRRKAGFRVFIHSPMDIPQVKKSRIFEVHFSRSIILQIKPKYIKTTEQVKSYSIKKRECFLPNEKKLKYFKVYTPDLCRLECDTDTLIHFCNCVLYYMPRNDTMKICPDITCFELMNTLQYVRTAIGDTAFAAQTNITCDCKPLCTSLKYDIVPYNHSYHDNDRKTFHKNDKEYAQLVVYFKNNEVLTLEKNERYGISDLISNFGGLLALFTGISILSIVEFIYFLTIRVYYNRQIFGNWAGK